MTAEDESESADVADDEAGGDDAPKKQKRSKPRRQSGTAVAFQKRASVRKLPERTTSSHLVERKGKNQLEALTGAPKQDRRGSATAIKAATSAMRAARGVPGKRGVSRAASSQQAPRRPDRAVAPGKKKTPARSSSSHALKAVKRDGSDMPTITGADLLNLRKAQKADDNDDCSVQSDLESTYTMDSINLRKSQIHHDDGKKESCCYMLFFFYMKYIQQAGVCRGHDPVCDTVGMACSCRNFRVVLIPVALLPNSG